MGVKFVLLKKTAIAILAAAAAAAPFSASASGPPAEPRTPEPERQEPRTRRGAAPELICRSIEIAATREMPMVCMSAAEWRRAEQ
jgi:hypothetical protein